MSSPLTRFTPSSLAPPENPVLGKADHFDSQGEHQAALETLHQAVQQHDAGAMARLGKRLFYGDRAPQAMKDGARLLQLAARDKNGEALCQVACFHALGLFPQSWQKALDHLAASARAQWLPAQGQLLALCPDKALRETVLAGNTDDTAWDNIRRAIDPAVWLQPAGTTILSQTPAIHTIRDFIPQTTCQWLMALAQSGLQRARVYDAASQRETVSETRTNRSMTFTLMMSDVATLLVQAHIGATIETPVREMEAIMVLHYARGEEITPHYDFIHPDSRDFHQQIGQMGQRRITFIIYLNDDYSGGETTFPELGLSNRGHTGDAIYFVNIDAEGQPDLRTLHTGSPPVSGEKWIMTQFVREREVINIKI